MRSAQFRTRITELFGIRHPIVCGGLMWLADARYVAAVVNAGGMGFITAVTFPDPERFRDELRLCRELTGGKPFGVNISMSSQPDRLDRSLPHVKVLCEEGVRFVETAGSRPEILLPHLKDAGITVMHKVPALRYAVSADRTEGIDALCLIGAEAGGHPGTYMVGTMVQAALAPRRLTKPLVVGGGFGTGSQLVAALAMGADAVLLGSRMCVAEEIGAHDAYKRRLVAGDGTESRVVMQTFRGHHRVLDNESARAVLALEATGNSDFEAYRPHVDGQVVRAAYDSGDTRTGMIDWGQSVAFADAIEPVEAIFDRILDDAGEALRTLERVRAVDLPAGQLAYSPVSEPA